MYPWNEIEPWHEVNPCTTSRLAPWALTPPVDKSKHNLISDLLFPASNTYPWCGNTNGYGQTFVFQKWQMFSIQIPRVVISLANMHCESWHSRILRLQVQTLVVWGRLNPAEAPLQSAKPIGSCQADATQRIPVATFLFFRSSED